MDYFIPVRPKLVSLGHEILAFFFSFLLLNFCLHLNQDDPQQALILEVIRNDNLRQIERQKYVQGNTDVIL